MNLFIKRHASILVVATTALVIMLSSCRDDFEPSVSSGHLVFSSDTLFLDTVFSNIGSSTYRLKVYNRSNSLISIPQVQLAQGQSSAYRLNVDGTAGKYFENVEILPRDSIYVFVETTIDFNDFATAKSSFLYTDAIEFDTGDHLQKVQLVTLVQDAVFLYPKRDAAGVKDSLSLGTTSTGEELKILGYYLKDDQLDFTAEKPYVIYGYAAVPPGKTLRVAAGARLHFHAGSGILVANDASLEVNGAQSTDSIALENEVIFEGDRLEPLYTDVPGQWGAIWLTAGSKNNSISHATIKNATVGLLVDANAGNGSPTLSIDNTQIYNSANSNLLAQNASINGENLVFNNAGISSLWLSYGGSYNFKHCTIANFAQQGFRQAAAVQIDNFIPLASGEVITQDLVAANFSNCIIDGDRGEELKLGSAQGAVFNYTFINCLIRFEDSFDDLTGTPPYVFDDSVHYVNILLNQDADFKNPLQNDLRIGNDSATNGSGEVETAASVPFDILGTPRSLNPDMGAYESIVFDPDQKP